MGHLADPAPRSRSQLLAFPAWSAGVPNLGRKAPLTSTQEVCHTYLVSGRTAPLYPTSGFTAAGWTAAGWPVLDAGGIANLVALAGGTLVLAGLPPFASATGKDLLMAGARRWGQAVEELYALSIVASSGR